MKTVTVKDWNEWSDMLLRDDPATPPSTNDVPAYWIEVPAELVEGE